MWTLLCCNPRRIATRSALTSNCSAAGCSPLAAGCSLGVRSMLVLRLSSTYVRVIIVVGRNCSCSLWCLWMPTRLSQQQYQTNMACGSSRRRGYGYALGWTLRVFAGTLVRRAHLVATISSMYKKCGPIKENAAQLKNPHCCLNTRTLRELFPPIWLSALHARAQSSPLLWPPSSYYSSFPLTVMCCSPALFRRRQLVAVIPSHPFYSYSYV